MSDSVSDVESTKPAAGEKKPEREGLPPGYRMRADAHYVDQLTTRKGERVYKDQPAKTGRETDGEADRDRRDLRDRRSERVLAHMADEIATIESATAMMTNGGTALAQRVSLDLVRSHAMRAGWLLRAQSLLDGANRGALRTRPVGALLEQVRAVLAAECRLTGVTLVADVADWRATLSVDEPEFVAGISGAVFAMLALVSQVEAPVVRLTAHSTDEACTVDISQEVVGIANGSAARFFDLSWTDRPGGWTAALGAAAARAVVQRDGGSATLVPGERRGCTIRLSFRT